MSVLKNQIKKYEKRGFKARRKRTKKHGKVVILTKKKAGVTGFLGGLDVRFIYYADGDSNTNNIREFLKEYSRFYEKNDLDTGDQGIFMCSGKTDNGLFRDLKKALVRDKDIASTVSIKTLPRVTVEKRRKVIEEEHIKERVTEREIMRRRVTEERISVRGLVGKIQKFEPPTRPKREKQLENMLVSYLQAFYPNISTQMTYERARIDAQIGSIGIEIKYQPSAGDFDRLYGQIEKYLKHLDYVIVIISYERSKESTRSFKRRLKERGWLDKRVKVISK